MTVAKHKTTMAKFRVPNKLLINNCIGSCDQPIEPEIFAEWVY